MKLIIMRGVSGSGKSTLASELAMKHQGVVFSTDDFFMEDGVYNFNPKKIGINHQLNQDRCRNAMRDQFPCIIIDNTNTQIWEMEPYAEMALIHGYDIEIHEPEQVDLDTIMERQNNRKDSNKSLPVEIVQKMLDRFEPCTSNQLIERVCPF